MRYLLLLLLFPLAARAQDIPIGTWRTHPSFNQLDDVERVGDRIWGGSRGGLFFYDRSDGSVRRLSKIDGISGVSVRDIKHSPEAGLLVVAYTDGGIDLVGDDGTIRTIGAIVRAGSIQGSRRINHIYVDGTLAYLSCDFGVVVLDLVRAEVRENYTLRDEAGVQMATYSSAVSAGERLVVVTTNGLQVGALADNLLDNRNWSPLPSPLPAGAEQALAELDGVVYGLAGRVWALRGDTWEAVTGETGYGRAVDANVGAGSITFATSVSALTFD
ncbi:MAG: hypothetical protein WBA12_05855, partial [Catalinimonas sp.]